MKIKILSSSMGKDINWLVYAVRKSKHYSPIKIVDLTYFKNSKHLYSITIFLSAYDLKTLNEMI